MNLKEIREHYEKFEKENKERGEGDKIPEPYNHAAVGVLLEKLDRIEKELIEFAKIYNLSGKHGQVCINLVIKELEAHDKVLDELTRS